MTDGTFKIEVPITIKGGRTEGQKIGENIAKQIEKSMRSLGFGKGASTAIGKTATSPGGFGFEKIGKLLGRSTLILGAVLGALVVAVKFLAKASPYLKGILDVFGRAMMIFFRPFGDFLATLLRPLAILLLRAAVKWLAFVRKPLPEGTPQIPEIGNLFADIPIKIANAFLGLGGKIGQWIYDEIIVPTGIALAQEIIKIWNWIEDFPGWVWEKITSIWNWSQDIGAWLWGKITTIWNWENDVGAWLWSKIMTIWNWTFDFGTWIWDKITSIWNWTYDFGAWLWGKITSIFPDRIKKILGIESGEGQTGIARVQSEGLYKLHPGEQVIPRSRVGERSVIFKPTFQISTGGMSEIDIDEMARRSGRMVEMDLKRRGII